MKVLMVIAAIFVAVALNVTGASATVDPNYTNGTQCSGPYCANPNPPPTDPVFAQGQDCKIDLIDPTGYTFVTEHFVYGTVPPPAGVVPVSDDASKVVLYNGEAPGLLAVNVESFVAGQQGFRADTWNIGTGVTAWVPFNCTPPTTTTTTVAPTTTTTVALTTTTTTEPNATTTTAAIVPPGQNPPGPTSLPNTGSSPWPLAAVAVALLAVGAALAARRHTN